jgi:hypothetical protein
MTDRFRIFLAFMRKLSNHKHLEQTVALKVAVCRNIQKEFCAKLKND